MSTPLPAPAPAPATRLSLPTRVRRYAMILLLPLGVLLGIAAARAFTPPAAPVPVAAPTPATPDDPLAVHLAAERWESSGVRTEPVTSAPLVDHVWRTGRVAADDDRVAHISSPVEGIIRHVPVRLGQEVKAGQVLVVLDSKEVGQAKLDLVTTRTALAAERSRAAWATQTATNTESLVRAVETRTPIADIERGFKDRPVGERRQALLTAYTNRNHLRAQLEAQESNPGLSPATTRKTVSEAEAAEALLVSLCEEFKFQARQQARQSALKLQEAEATFDVARTRLLVLGYRADQVATLDPVAEGAAAALYEVRAPFTGTVVEKHAVQSERVDTHFQLFRLVDLSAVWIQADVYEADLPLLQSLDGQKVLFRAPGAGLGERAATVFYSGDVVDPGSRAINVTASATNADRALKPGMYVEVGIPRGRPTPVVHVPATAVQHDNGKAFVFVHTGGDAFRRTDITVAREAGDRVAVSAGLTPGESVVVAGGFVLKSELFRDRLAGD